MAPRSGALFVKAAAVAAVLAMLVVPSLGRCHGSPSPAPPPITSTPAPPAPLPPTPAPAPGPMSCNDCYSQCYLSCDASIPSQCSLYCDREDSCNSCKTGAIEECRTSKNCTDSCDECNDAPNFKCAFSCTTRNCIGCHYGAGQMCNKACREECSAPKCVP
ncbi:hypothetical protein CFC21_008115 [Triticum aestivum]|uniref:Bowman-Birk serine protease inhibitors family domain-containing protein n=2 Tax=Triticum aestivum TaxID=4565 RepID=A0A9R1DFS7_WHEAT|nr:hypothetical protein CFC21_008113 [Triticum aestivum]KAF6990971.1 hypothetical protein CFC21_008114 [Triticum aestivum]KAF6990972.1 hypothetical protein CFC21_008115 [Triticum aestivum]